MTLVDTAGLRETDNEVEAEGVRRAERAAEGAAVSLLVLDGSEPLLPEHRRSAGANERRPRLVVANKADLHAAWAVSDAGVDDSVETSARTGEGLDRFAERLAPPWAGGC